MERERVPLDWREHRQHEEEREHRQHEEERVHTHEWMREHRSPWVLVARKLFFTLVAAGVVGGFIYLLITILRNTYGKPKYCKIDDKVAELLEAITNQGLLWDKTTGKVTGNPKLAGSKMRQVMDALSQGLPTNPDVTFLDQSGKGCVYFMTSSTLCPKGDGTNTSAYAITSDMTSTDPTTDEKNYTLAKNRCAACKDRKFWISMVSSTAAPTCSCLCGPTK
jgi:hypothetical protein